MCGRFNSASRLQCGISLREITLLCVLVVFEGSLVVYPERGASTMPKKGGLQTYFSKQYEYFLIRLRLLWQMFKLYVIGVYSLEKQAWNGSFASKGYPEQRGKVAIVTGGAAGIGRYITRNLVKNHCDVYIGSRCQKEAEQTIREIKKKYPSATVKFIPLDLASLKSVRSFVEAFLQERCPLHILINNAGVMLTPYSVTEDGFETQYQVNFLGHCLLTQLLLDKLKASGGVEVPARIVNVTSTVHFVAEPEPTIFPNPVNNQEPSEVPYSAHNSYAVSKLALVLMTYKLASMMRGSNSWVTVNCVHPGVVNSGLYQHVHWSVRWILAILAYICFKSEQGGADLVVDVALSPLYTNVSERYFENGRCAKSSEASQDLILIEKVWRHAQWCLGQRPKPPQTPSTEWHNTTPSSEVQDCRDLP